MKNICSWQRSTQIDWWFYTVDEAPLARRELFPSPPCVKCMYIYRASYQFHTFVFVFFVHQNYTLTGLCRIFITSHTFHCQRVCSKTQPQKRCFVYTGITSALWLSSQVKVRPSMYVGRRQHGQRHPVDMGSEGGTIMSTLSSRWTTPITLTVLPSFIYLQNQMYANLFPHVFKSKIQFSWEVL